MDSRVQGFYKRLDKATLLLAAVCIYQLYSKPSAVINY